VTKLNRMNPGDNLGPESASDIRLATVRSSPAASPVPPTPTTVDAQSGDTAATVVVLLAVPALVLIVWILLRRKNAADVD
jgi:hypothetical protein